MRAKNKVVANSYSSRSQSNSNEIENQRESNVRSSGVFAVSQMQQKYRDKLYTKKLTFLIFTSDKKYIFFVSPKIAQTLDFS